MARNALPSPSVSATSFQHLKSQQSIPAASPPPADHNKVIPCPDCKTNFRMFTEGAHGWNTKPHQICIECHRARRRRRRKTQVAATNVQALETNPISQIASLEHHIFTKGGWRRAQQRDHPRASITISIDRLAHPKGKAHSHGPGVEASVSAIADTGAQSDLWSLEEFLACGFSREDLHTVNLSLSVANRSPIAIEGAFFARLKTTSRSGTAMSCRSMVYVSSSVRDMYLSYESLLNLGLLSRDFPSCDITDTCSESPDPATHKAAHTPPPINAMRPSNDGCRSHHLAHNDTCSCPQRSVPPPRPTELPFPCVSANNDRMKAWLLDRYGSSTFNTCPHQALPCMEGPPIEIHVDPAATPKACHTPATVPLHWQQKVHDDLLRDEALGLIERVPYGEPVTWCHHSQARQFPPPDCRPLTS